MNLGIFLLTVVMLMTIVVMRRSMEKEYIARIDSALAEDVSVARLEDLGGSLVRPDAPVVLIRKAIVNHNLHDVYFDLRPIDREVNQFEFFLTLGMMFSMIMFMYIMAYHQIDVTHAQLRGLLNLALPKQVAEQFESDPTAYTRKCRMPATILFMDFVGFTRTCETLAHDPDLLSEHLEAAMDRLVGELSTARHDHRQVHRRRRDELPRRAARPGHAGRSRPPRGARGARQHRGPRLARATRTSTG